MTKLVYYIFYGISTLPFEVLYAISDLLMPLLYHVIRYRRGIVRRNLVTSFPEKSIGEVVAIEKEFYHWFCDYFLESINLIAECASRIRKCMSNGISRVATLLLSLGTTATGSGSLAWART